MMAVMRGLVEPDSLLWLAPPYKIAHASVVMIDMGALSAQLAGMALEDCHADMPRRAVLSRQLSFLAGRCCAETALLRASGQAAKVGRNMAGAPCWPRGFTGAITHHQHLALAVAGAGDYGLGVDSEIRVGEAQAQAIWDVCCTASDRRFIAEGDRLERATLVFSAKEAAYKAIALLLGRVADFTEFEVAEHELPAQRLWLEPVERHDWPVPLPPLPVNYLTLGEMVHCWLDVRPAVA